MPSLVVAVALASLALGAWPLPLPGRLLVAGATALLAWRISRRWRPRRRLLLLLLIPLLLLWSLALQPRPGPSDPLRRIPAAAARSAPLTLEGRLPRDPRPWRSGAGCSAVLAVPGGRVDLSLDPCPPRLAAGVRLRVQGRLRRPLPAAHPLLGSTAERLARQGIWTRMRPDAITVLGRRAAPLAALRRRVAQSLIAVGGPASGGLLAALVLGGAVVPLPPELSGAFRAAGLSHALAASGFHLSVLLGAVLVLGRRLPRAPRWGLAGGTLLLFLALAGPQPSVVRAVLMGGAAFAALESGRRTRPLGVLLLTLLAMALLHPPWLAAVGFQLSAAATAGLIVTAPPLERWLAGDRAVRWRRWLAPALAVPIAASLWTLPLQLLHFGSAPLYAVPANLLVTPLLAPLTLAAMALALVSLLLPPLLPLLAPPVLLAAGALRLLVDRLAALPGAQLHPGRPGVVVALLLTLALLPWLVAAARRWRLASLPLLAVAMLVHGGRVWGDQLLLVHRPGSTWLLARHHGRAALVARSGGARSCAGALRLAQGLGHARLDWILLLDPVASEASDCWRRLSPMVLTSAGGAAALHPGQRVASPGLMLAPLSHLSRAAELRVGGSRWLLLPDGQALWTLRSGEVALPGDGRLDGVWLARTPADGDLSWLLARRPRHLWISRPPPPGTRGGAPAWTGRVGSLAARL